VVVDSEHNICVGDSAHRRHVDASDEQHVHHDDTDFIDGHQPTGFGQLKRTDEHDLGDGKPGRSGELKCADGHDLVGRQSVGIRERGRADEHDIVGWHSIRFGQL
jgi:hypothetical protein